MAIVVLFWYFFGLFFVLSGANPGWGISYFLCIFGVLGVVGLCSRPAGSQTLPLIQGEFPSPCHDLPRGENQNFED